MDQETLLQKIETLEAQKERAIADVNAISGAIQFAKELLADMEQPEAVTVTETKPEAAPAA